MKKSNYKLTQKIYEEVLGHKVDKFALPEDFELEENEKVYMVLEGYMELLKENIEYQHHIQEEQK